MCAYVLLLYEGEYEEQRVYEVRVFAALPAAASAGIAMHDALKAHHDAAQRWREAVDADYHRLKPAGWSEVSQQNNPATLGGKHVDSWRKAAKLHECPVGPRYTEVALFGADDKCSKEIDLSGDVEDAARSPD